MSETDLSITHPQISSLYNLYLSETQPFRKVHRMIDLFETIIKMHTVVIMGEYFKRNELSEMAKGMLAYGLQTPSLGTWQKFSRDLCSELISNNHPFVLNYFKDEFLLFDKSNNDKTNIISFRNRYAHGATPTDNDCEADIIQFEPFLLKLLASKWLHESQLIIVDNFVFIQSKTTLEKLNLHPILVCKEETNGQPFTFFNDIKDEKVGLLNYPLSKHYREQKTYIEEFYAVLPLKEWKQNVSNEFKQYIEELTEGFKGRIMELKAISTFISTKEKGYLSIQGNPGIGKSALIAQVSRELNKSEYNKKYKLCEYFIRRGTRSDNNINLLNHLLKTTDIYYPEGKSIMPEGNSNWDLQKALFAKWNAFGNGGLKFKLIFLIDGLDEGVENDILNYLPRENFKNILFIYGSRHGGHLKLASFWTELPIENHETILLSGLNKEDIRAFLYEVVNKYEIDQIWIDEILNRSEGNPLYLKLLCNALENGSIEINNSKALPKEIDSYYKAILDRYAQQTDGDALFECLLLFAVAEDYLTPAHLGIMNSMSIASQQRVMSILTEVLYENPQTDFVLDYQLFHESFREYLIKTYPLEIKKANQKIIDSCQKWQELETLFEQRYVLEHYATHLVKSATVENKEILVELSKNVAFQKTQNQVLRDYNANYSLLRAALLAASELNQKEDVIEIGLCLVDLQYEEKNDVQSIIDMVANNEMELVIQRIESFGGNDRDGLQQKFILYMLCLMELTLLNSKVKPFRKEAIEKLLKHFDDNIPVDHSVLNWNDFFPSYLVFLISVEIKKLDLDYYELYKRTDNWDFDWIKDKGPYTEVQIEILIQSADLIMDKFKNCILFKEIAVVFYNQGNLTESGFLIEKSLQSAESIVHKDNYNYYWEKSKAFGSIAIVFANQDEINKSIQTAELIITREHGKYKDSVLKEIADILAKQGNLEKSNQIVEIINDNFEKSSAFKNIAIELEKQGLLVESSIILEKSIQTAESICDDFEKSTAFKNIAIVLANQGKLTESNMVLVKSIETAEDIYREVDKISIFNEIAIVLSNQGKLNESIDLLEKSINIIENFQLDFRISVYNEIAIILANQGSLDKSNKLLEKSIITAEGIDNDHANGFAYKSIALLFANNGDIKKSIQMANKIYEENDRISAYKEIAVVFANQTKFAESSFILNKSTHKVEGIKTVHQKSSILNEIAILLANQGEIGKSIQTAEGINDKRNKISALNKIAEVFANQGNLIESTNLLEKSFHRADSMSNVDSVLKEIAVLKAKKGEIEKSIQIAEDIEHNEEKNLALKGIAIVLLNQDDIDKSIQTAERIGADVEFIKGSAFKEIAIVLAKQSKIEKSIQVAESIINYFQKISALNEIAVVLADQGKLSDSNIILDKSFHFAQCIVDDWKKILAFNEIAILLTKQGKLLESSLLLEKSIETAEGINDKRTKISALNKIAVVFAYQTKIDKSIKVIFKINSSSDRIKALVDIGREFYKCHQLQNIKQILAQIPDGEAVFFYKRGMTEAITATNANASNVLELLELVKEDTKSIAHLLQMHALYLCFFEKTNPIKMQRLNKTLNIQWAIDIAAKFEKEFERASHNIQEWISEIEDENDREDVLSWAEKVEQGKMTEEKFLERINKL